MEERAHEDVVYLGNARGQSAGPSPAMIDVWCAEHCCRSTAAAAQECVAMLVGDRLAYQLCNRWPNAMTVVSWDLGRSSRSGRKSE